MTIRLVIILLMASGLTSGCRAWLNTEETRAYLDTLGKAVPDNFDLAQRFEATTWYQTGVGSGDEAVFTVEFTGIEENRLLGTCSGKSVGDTNTHGPVTWPCEWWVDGNTLWTPGHKTIGTLVIHPPASPSSPRNGVWEVVHDPQSQTLRLARIFAVDKGTGHVESQQFERDVFVANAVGTTTLQQVIQGGVPDPPPAADASSVVPPSADPSSADSPPDDNTPGERVEDRLRTLKNLHEQGLITDDEYETKRKALLEEL